MATRELLNTKEVAGLLNINEKMVYSLISDKGLPATKVTGKWLFPRKLVETWIENNTINHPENPLHADPGLVIITGSNDILLEKAIGAFNRLQDKYLAVFGNAGSMGGISALKDDRCHIAASHLMETDENEYNFEAAGRTLGRIPAVVNFCCREQGIIVFPGNPKSILTISDIAGKKIRMINRPEGTGTRLLFDREIEKAGINKENIIGYDDEVTSHMAVALVVLSKKADAGIGIRAVASLLGLDFMPLRWETFDLLTLRSRFFEQGGPAIFRVSA